MDQTNEKSLDLDLEMRGAKKQPVARVAVVGTWGITRDGVHATITADCTNAAAFAREIERLHGELDEVLARGSAELGQSAPESRPRRTREASPAASAPSPERPRLTVTCSVADVMTRKVQTVGPNMPVAAAKALMDSGAFRHVVVLSDDGAIEGVMSHRDVFFGPLAWAIGQGKGAYEKLLNTTRVKDVMHTDVATIDPAAPLQDAAALMSDRKIGCLPVVEADRLIGIVTDGDLVALFAEANR